MIGGSELVKVDAAHSALVQGLVMASKPRKILELGLGGGETTDAILRGLQYNQQKFDYTLVDNWCDWGGRKPEVVEQAYGHSIKILTSDEKDFVFSCKERYDFIMSDADHHQADQWFEYVYENLLTPGGILIYHDVNFVDKECFENLKTIYHTVNDKGISHNLFNKNSIPGERCQRGLLVIFGRNEYAAIQPTA